MQISLYDATVRGFVQIMTAMQGFMERALKQRPDSLDLQDVVQARLFPDMMPFRFQVISAIQHSVGAVEGVKSGLFMPPKDVETDFTALHAAVAEASARLQAYTPEEINALGGRELVFELPQAKLRFVAEDFLLSFSVPNFHFHATTAYGILRMKGVPLGKRDYLGRLRIKR